MYVANLAVAAVQVDADGPRSAVVKPGKPIDINNGASQGTSRSCCGSS